MDPSYPPAHAVAYQGGPGAFSEAAARLLAGPDVPLLPCRTFADLFDVLRSGRVAEAVVPTENVVWGAVAPVHEALAGLRHTVLGTRSLPIRQALIAAPGVPFEALRRVRSHPVALGQCRRFFEAHPHLEAVEDDDTGLAVAHVVLARPPGEAAIGAARAAALYGGTVLRPSVDDVADNRTLFRWIRADG